jgi:hypothetical protein
LAVVLAAVASYPSYFIRFAARRDFPRVTLPLSAVGFVLLGARTARPEQVLEAFDEGFAPTTRPIRCEPVVRGDQIRMGITT